MQYKTIDFRIEKNNPKNLISTPENRTVFVESNKNAQKYYNDKLGSDHAEGDAEIVQTECPFCEKIYKDVNIVTYSRDKKKRILEAYHIDCGKFVSLYQEAYDDDNIDQ